MRSTRISNTRSTSLEVVPISRADSVEIEQLESTARADHAEEVDSNFSATSMSALEADMARIAKIRESRRTTMEAQVQCASVQSMICDTFRAWRNTAGVGRSIDDLKIDDPALYKYIEDLELVRSGIWCSKCNAARAIGMVTFADLSKALERVATISADLRRGMGSLVDALATATTPRDDGADAGADDIVDNAIDAESPGEPDSPHSDAGSHPLPDVSDPRPISSADARWGDAEW